jgi:hypothetical protein
MITFNKLGNYGLFGNQMFQYATLFSIAHTRKYDFGVPYKRRSPDKWNDFCLPDCFKNLSAKDSSYSIPQYKAEEHNFCYNPGIFGIQDNTDILGYFQSEKYFKDYRNQLLKEFEFTSEIKEKAEEIRNLSKDRVISIHIRLGDYVHQQQNHPVCTMEYYKEALTHMPDDAMLFIFSDDVETATNLFKDLGRKMVFPDTNNRFVDMCTMTLCDYHIIANSSFSWWGSWLSNSKKTVAPSAWFGPAPHMPKNWSDVYCKDWVIV